MALVVSISCGKNSIELVDFLLKHPHPRNFYAVGLQSNKISLYRHHEIFHKVRPHLVSSLQMLYGLQFLFLKHNSHQHYF